MWIWLRVERSSDLRSACLSFASPAKAVRFPSAVCLGPLAKFFLFPLFPVQQKNYNFRCLQTSSFANRSWSRTDVVVWLEDLQTHRWSNDSDTISFTKPWSQGKLSNQEWEKLQHIFQVYRVSFTRDMQELVKMMQPQEDCEWRDGTLYPVAESDQNPKDNCGHTDEPLFSMHPYDFHFCLKVILAPSENSLFLL